MQRGLTHVVDCVAYVHGYPCLDRPVLQGAKWVSQPLIRNRMSASRKLAYGASRVALIRIMSGGALARYVSAGRRRGLA